MEEAMTEPDLEKSDEVAFRTVLAHRSMLAACVGLRIHGSNLAEDVFSDVTLEIVRSWRKYDPTRQFGPWARCIAKRVCMDALRKQRREPLLLGDEAIEQLGVLVESFGTQGELEERKEALRDCMQKLSEANQKLVQYRYFERLPNPDIALRVGKSVKALYAAYSRLHTLLADCVERTLRTL
jgi:RNA polymerase sigma-70 factor (ECF subfamily)